MKPSRRNFLGMLAAFIPSISVLKPKQDADLGEWREFSRAEVFTCRYNNPGSLKGNKLLSDYDILTKWMKYPEDEAKEMIVRIKIQKLEDLKLQILAQNPQILGIGVPNG